MHNIQKHIQKHCSEPYSGSPAWLKFSFTISQNLSHRELSITVFVHAFDLDWNIYSQKVFLKFPVFIYTYVLVNS